MVTSNSWNYSLDGKCRGVATTQQPAQTISNPKYYGLWVSPVTVWAMGVFGIIVGEA